MSVLCLQWLAKDKKLKLKSHSVKQVQFWERKINKYEEYIEEKESSLSLEREALQGLLPSSPSKWLIVIISGN